MEPDDAARQRRLAAAGLADHPEGLALLDSEVDVVERGEHRRLLISHFVDDRALVGEALGQPGDAEQRLGAHAAAPDEGAGGAVLGEAGVEGDGDRVALVAAELAARLERTARRQVGEAWRLARDRRRRRGVGYLERGHRLDQAAGVGVAGAVHHRPVEPGLQPPPGVHHDDLVAGLGDHAEVVGDEHDRHPVLGLGVHQQREDLLLGGDVERGGRLVGEQQLRFGRDRDRDHHPLAHAAGELMRIGGEAALRRRHPDLVEQLDRAPAGLPLAEAAALAQRLDHLVADREDRVQARGRVLEDHRDLGPAELGQTVLGGRRQVLAEPTDLAAEDLSRDRGPAPAASAG